MTIDVDINTVLDAYGALDALVSGRNYKSRTPQTLTYPFTVTTRVSTNTITSLEGTNALSNPRYQIDCYDDSSSGARDVAEKVKAAMDAATTFKALLLDDRDLSFDPDLKVYRVLLDFSVWTTN